MRRTEKAASGVGEKRVAIMGAGDLASFLAPALREAGYRVTEIIARARPGSMRRARVLARKVGAKAVTVESAALDASVLWVCVPDREIRAAAGAVGDVFSLRSDPQKAAGLERQETWGTRCAFHSSGALGSDELGPLREVGIAVASVHPLMTFVEGARPSLKGVPFALEGDTAATTSARRLVNDLGGEAFTLAAKRKGAYHAWATMTSPLLVAYLVTLEEAARGAGLSRARARRMSLPIIRQTLVNYAERGPAKSFSGPLIRGDVGTVAKHLELLRAHPMTREVYVALANIALQGLPAKNQDELRRLVTDQVRERG